MTVRWMGSMPSSNFHRYPAALAELRANLAPALLPRRRARRSDADRVRLPASRSGRFAPRASRWPASPRTRGDTVYLLSSEANRDPAAFDDPERFDIHRKARPHLGFSHGMHQCIGMNLARVEAQAMLGRLLVAGPDAPALDVVDVDYGDDSVVRGPQRLLLRSAARWRPRIASAVTAPSLSAFAPSPVRCCPAPCSAWSTSRCCWRRPTGSVLERSAGLPGQVGGSGAVSAVGPGLCRAAAGSGGALVFAALPAGHRCALHVLDAGAAIRADRLPLRCRRLCTGFRQGRGQLRHRAMAGRSPFFTPTTLVEPHIAAQLG